MVMIMIMIITMMQKTTDHITVARIVVVMIALKLKYRTSSHPSSTTGTPPSHIIYY